MRHHFRASGGGRGVHYYIYYLSFVLGAHFISFFVLE